MYKLVVLACAVAAVAAEADPTLAYANGLGYAGLPYAAGAYAAPLHAGAYAPLHAAGAYAAGHVVTGYAHHAPAVVAHAAPVAAPAVVAHAAPAAGAYALPPVRTIQEAPIVETVVEPVEQWGYKVAY